MSLTKIIRSVSKLVLAGDDDTGDDDEGEYVPAVGEKFNVYQFEGTSPSSPADATVKLIWDFGGAGEELLWTIHHEEPMPAWLEFMRVGDGVKIMACVLSNAGGANYTISGSFRGELLT